MQRKQAIEPKGTLSRECRIRTRGVTTGSSCGNWSASGRPYVTPSRRGSRYGRAHPMRTRTPSCWLPSGAARPSSAGGPSLAARARRASSAGSPAHLSSSAACTRSTSNSSNSSSPLPFLSKRARTCRQSCSSTSMPSFSLMPLRSSAASTPPDPLVSNLEKTLRRSASSPAARAASSSAAPARSRAASRSSAAISDAASAAPLS
mmetsp:Transcript_25088/g.78765  ORF Transcript_25088/g.78765 Transcript_25088/m.78765 type:complete len:205 (+) Transcript_25088:802-1416(+)